MAPGIHVDAKDRQKFKRPTGISNGCRDKEISNLGTLGMGTSSERLHQKNMAIHCQSQPSNGEKRKEKRAGSGVIKRGKNKAHSREKMGRRENERDTSRPNEIGNKEKPRVRNVGEDASKMKKYNGNPYHTDCEGHTPSEECGCGIRFKRNPDRP